MKAVVVDGNGSARLALREVDKPSLAPDQVLIRVGAISLNRGELRGAQTAQAGYRPGWDIAGTVEQTAPNGTGLKAGTRVVGFVPNGAWAEYVAVPINALAELPDSVTFAQAATLPVAGLTALYSLDKGGNLLERKVLITGASGGVGHLAVQIAKAAGAHTTAVIRNAKYESLVREAGADEVIISEDAHEAAEKGPYWLIVDGVGGKVLGNAMGMLDRQGVCVCYGVGQDAAVTFELPKFFRIGGAQLYGFILFYEVIPHPAASGLARLVQMIADGRLKPLISVEESWTQIGEVAQRYLDRGFPGKAVLHLDK